ncbi:MAG: ABC transporter permease subunit [Erysipelotrichaceae bacterium]
MFKKIVLIITAILCLGITPISAAEEEQETFTVGMECNYAPFNWTQIEASDTAVQLESGYCDGYDVAVARKIAEKLDKKVVIKKMSWDGLEPALQANVIDAVIAGMTDTIDRRQRVNFTTPYYESDMVMIVRKDDKLANAKVLGDFSNHKVLGQLNTLYDTVIDQIPNVKHAKALKDYPAMVMQLNEGLVDAITAELPVAGGIISTNPDLTYIEFDKGKGFDINLTDTSVSIAINKDNPQLLNDVQKALDSISKKERKAMMQDAIDRIPATIVDLSSNLFVAAGQIVQTYGPLFVDGIKSTLILAFFGTIFGLLIGLFVGALKAIKVEARDSFFTKCWKRITSVLISIYVEVFRGTPMMVQGAFIFYAGRSVFNWDPFVAGIFVITINTGAYMAEIVRSGIQSVDDGQAEAARSIGMSSIQTMTHVIIPQAIRNSFPSIGNEFVINIKDSSVLNVIAVTELFYQASSVAGSLYAFVPAYFVVALIYLCLTFPTTRILAYIEKRMNTRKTPKMTSKEESK